MFKAQKPHPGDLFARITPHEIVARYPQNHGPHDLSRIFNLQSPVLCIFMSSTIWSLIPFLESAAILERLRS
jgi:hypothetical protein